MQLCNLILTVSASTPTSRGNEITSHKCNSWRLWILYLRMQSGGTWRRRCMRYQYGIVAVALAWGTWSTGRDLGLRLIIPGDPTGLSSLFSTVILGGSLRLLVKNFTPDLRAIFKLRSRKTTVLVSSLANYKDTSIGFLPCCPNSIWWLAELVQYPSISCITENMNDQHRKVTTGLERGSKEILDTP